MCNCIKDTSDSMMLCHFIFFNKTFPNTICGPDLKMIFLKVFREKINDFTNLSSLLMVFRHRTLLVDFWGR